ncbi:centrosomal protein of 295 kDa isoform X2 [Acanthochromis polyacanthus]|uniref:centrosomal protein of 295 kDa isoform X2 n=1 Tax=Acanthochromis polyacanthus TaxID=80966 RepID=UPI002234A554|nr:centrosomal protein of 295 kDa isoform X2 [Acanthochromis polyacanthus]
MKRKVSKLRLSPNEEARIIREECERRRKLRIQQVREQQRHFAQQICREVEQKQQQELKQLEEELRLDWERQQREKLHKLERLYQESLQLLGQGHRSAKENEPDLAAIAQREEENHAKAEERYREALKELKSQKIKNHERQNQFISARKKALQAEKERSAKVSSLPPPPPNPIQSINPKKPHVVKRSDVSAFAATHYHMPESAVDRELDTEQPNAREEAELEVKRLHDLQREEKRRREEQLEKARLRGREALRREQLVQDRERLMVELEHMQQTDLLRRRQQVSQMPPQIFQPLYKRQETREDFQREMEFAFEDMYTGERRVKGDLVVRLVPEPLPAPSTGTQDQELDVTLDEINTQHDTEEDAGSTEQETSAEAEPSRPAPRRALKKLLDRIRNQRNQWTSSSRVPAADSPTVISDQIPERDTSIETGSLTAEEKDKPSEPRELSPPAATDASLSDVLADRIQEFEEERKKREEELEREKQQQVVLLQELEEQKSKLEQLLLEAQQEREDLKAAVAQKEPVYPPEVPVRDEEVTPGVATELIPPAGEDEHTRRIREYQQRLLEQNRIHQRSMEVARQRLEEYQRALRIRYNMTSTSLQPPIVPPGFVQSPLHSPPAPLQTPTAPAYLHDEPQTSVEANTRQPDTSALHLHRPGSSLSVGSRLPLDEVESFSHRQQRPDVTTWLTDNIMERVTEHLPERLKSPSASKETSKLYTTRLSTSFPLRPDPIQTSNQSFRDPQRVATPQISQQTESLSSTEDDVETERRQLQEVQRRMLEQREAVKLQQKQQEEQRQRHQVEMEQMRRQKEALQALIQTDEEPASETASDELVSQNIKESRLRLLASLLRAIEESNGGTLSHLEDSQEKEDSPQKLPSDGGETAPIGQISAPSVPGPASVLPTGLLHPPRAAKPPVTRVRLGFMEMTEQHELSAIQEVESPVDTSHVTGLEDSMAAPSQTEPWSLQQESESHLASDQTSSTSSSETSSHLMWRKKLLMEAGTSPEPSDSESVQRIISPLSSDSGRGADVSGPAATSYRSTAESPHRSPGSYCFSTSISTGSYVTSDPEQNADSDKSLPLRRQSEAALHDVSSPAAQSVKESSAAGSPGQDGDSVFDDSSIQRIIDKYMKELNISLSTAGRTTDSEGSYTEEAASSVSQPSLVRFSASRREDGNSTSRQFLLSDPAGAQRSRLELENPVDATPSLADDHDSFRPLIGQLAELSSCLAAPQRDSALEQLVGHPSAQSSAIGHLPGLSPSVGGWDSTLSRMIGRLSHQPSSDWPSGGQELLLMGQTEPSWLEEAVEEGQMRPLVGELDESAVTETGSERSHEALGVQPEVPSHHDTSSHIISSDPGVEQTRQNRSSVVDMSSQRAEDSFHPLLPEVTHNETLDPSMTFRLPSSPEGRPASGQHSASDRSTDSEPRANLSIGSDPSPERLRAEEPTGHSASSPALHESFSQLVTSQSQPHESVLTVSPTWTADVQETAQILSHLTVCDLSQPEVEIPERPEDSVSSSELKPEQNLNDAVSVPDDILEAAHKEKGILEQSEITLVSLTDSTLQDQDTTMTEGGGPEGQEMEDSESMLLPEDDSQTHPVVTALQFQWGPSRDQQDVHQQKLQVLLQRSNRRVEEIKAKAALTKTQPAVKAPCEGRERPKADKAPPAACKAKTKSEVQLKADMKSKGGPAVLQTQEKPELIKQKTPQLPSAVSRSAHKKVDEVKICTPEQRKRNITEMHQRTQRLYKQLEEVKQQKAVRSRQEDGAKNRLKAKEFHKKTLQKLRAKQSRQ